MGNRIQGITVEIGGDTTKLSTALKGVNGEIKNTQSQLKDVEKLLKMDPGNTELLAQKQKLLTQAVDETKTKLESLKTAADQAKTALDNGEISQQQYDALQREIIETENALKDLESQAGKASVAMQKISQTGEKLKTVGENVSNVGSSMTKNVTVPIIAMGTAAVASFNEIDSGYDTIVTKTGATGEALESLTKSADNVFGTMPVDMSDVGIAIGEVNTRFGSTGKTLEDLSAEFIKFAQINETDLNTAIGSTDKIMNQFGVDASQTKNVLVDLRPYFGHKKLNFFSLHDINTERKITKLQEPHLQPAVEFYNPVHCVSFCGYTKTQYIQRELFQPLQM